MPYLVLAYPKLSKKDFHWIQNYRQEHDPRYYSVVKPHFTIIFAIDDIKEEKFVEEVRKQVNGIKKFDFVIKVATINQDYSGNYFHEFLVPDQGYSNIVKLHDKLYSGKFSNYLRFDIDYIPHIGIGNNDKAFISKKRIDELNSQDISIKGSIESLNRIYRYS